MYQKNPTKFFALFSGFLLFSLFGTYKLMTSRYVTDVAFMGQIQKNVGDGFVYYYKKSLISCEQNRNLITYDCEGTYLYKWHTNEIWGRNGLIRSKEYSLIWGKTYDDSDNNFTCRENGSIVGPAFFGMEKICEAAYQLGLLK